MTTGRCERALVTLLGSAGPWRERLYLVGGLAPRYLVGKLPESVPAHVGTTDIDLVIELVVDAADDHAYRTLATNLKEAGFGAVESCRWTTEVDGVTVKLEFLCETDEVPPGKIFKPRGQKVGAKLGAFNIPGVALAAQDFVERELNGERLDGTGVSRVTLRVAALLPFVVLKITAYQDRHENKDAYDLVYCLLNYGRGPDDAGAVAASSPIREQPRVVESIELLEERFADVDRDGPGAYAAFLTDLGDAAEVDRLRRQAVVAVRRFIAALRAAARQ